jgi:CubicO group peptidase (beta-lactamase class C family)
MALRQVLLVLVLATLRVSVFGFPSPEWQTGSPEAHGLSSAKLKDVAKFAAEQKSGCLAVIKDGVLVHESYAVATPVGPTCMNCTNGTAQPVRWTPYTTSNIHSSTKSISAVLVGIAQDLGLLDIGDSAYMYGIRSWAPPDNRSSISIRQLLSMDSGLHWGYYSDYFQGMFLAKDKTAFAEALVLDHQPTSWWEYNNMATQNLEAVLRNATGGQDMHEFAQQHLFSKIGLAYPQEGVKWYKDDVGHTIAYDGIRLSCRTFARMGYLLLNNGSWAGEQVVSKKYVQETVRSSTNLNAAYGYLWWLGKPGHWVAPADATGRKEGNGSSPFFLHDQTDVFGMLGGQGQVAIVEPSRNAIYVRQGDSAPLGDDEFQLALLKMIRDAYN